MTSVNSPACLLARNHFYRNSPPGPEQMKPVFSLQRDSVSQTHREITLWVTITTPPGFPGGIRSKGLWVNITLGSKPPRPTDRGVK